MTDDLAAILAEVAELRAENARLRGLLGFDKRPATSQAEEAWAPTLFGSGAEVAPVDAGSPEQARLACYRSLFAGRSDVYATRWENARTGASGWSPAVRGGWSKASSRAREYLALTDPVLARHLAGELTAGLYPLLPGDACQLLACDFDGGTWALDALAYLDACTANGVPAALERSRSGDGAHVWVFF